MYDGILRTFDSRYRPNLNEVKMTLQPLNCLCYVYEMEWKEKMTAQTSQDIKPTVLQIIEHMNIEY